MSFELDTYTVGEGSSVTVKVTLSADPERNLTILLLAEDQGGATTADYSGIPASVSFSSGDTEKMFTFTAEQDSDDDDDESVKITFDSLPDRVSAGDKHAATIDITDDDVPDVTVKFDQSTYEAPEGGDIAVTIVLSVAPERQVTIPLTATPQDGATIADYTEVAESVTFGATDTSQSITFTAANDNVSDDGESVKIGFGSSLPTGVSAVSPSETTVTIIDVARAR